MKIWQDNGWERRLGDLQGNSLKVLFHLVMVAKWRNQVPGPVETSKAMSIRQPNVSRAYSELMKADFLRKADGVYYLHPLFCWKGDDRGYEEAVEEFSVPFQRLANLTDVAVRGTYG